jgi:glutamate decarboxylase
MWAVAVWQLRMFPMTARSCGMPLHSRNQIRDSLDDDVYAASDLRQIAPKYRFPVGPRSAEHTYAAVHDELMLDGNSRMNLATFCQTWGEPQSQQLLADCWDKNMIDKDEYPQTAELERRCVHMLADLWNSPEAENTIGCSTTGSSEAAMLGGLAMKWRWRERQRAAGRPIDRPNLICGPVQVCWHKFARYFDVELREVPLEPGRWMLTPDEVARRCDENTIGVVPTLGLTFTLHYEPVADICAALDRLQAERGWDIPVHVDGASGGMIAPFIHQDVVWDFRLPRVKSINTSGHKFGLTPLGCGWVIWRDTCELPEDLIFRVNYLGGDMPTFALNFSRPGGQIVCQYYNFLRLGREGYGRVHQACADTGAFLASEIAKLGLFEMLYDGRGGIPGACWKFRDGLQPNFSLYDLADRLRTRGWQVPAYSLPPNEQHTVVQRVLVRQGVSRDLAQLLLDDITSALEFFKRHPVGQPMDEAEGGGFHH